MKIIIRNCNVAELDIPLKYATKLYNEFAIRPPNAFYLRTRQRGMQNWDGKIKYITKTGQFKIGLLPSVYKRCIELGIKTIIVDMRQPLPKVSKVVTQIGKHKEKHMTARHGQFHIFRLTHRMLEEDMIRMLSVSTASQEKVA